MQIERYEGATVLRELYPQLGRILADSPADTVLYNSPEYLSSYVDTFDDKDYQVYTASGGQGLLGMAVFARAGEVLRFAGEGLWGYAGAVCERPDDVELLSQLLRVAVHHSGCASLEIGPLHASALPVYMAATQRVGVAAQAFKIAGGAPFVDTRAVERAAWVKSRKKAVYSDALRCEKRLAELGQVSLFKLDNASANPAQIRHAMDLFLGMYHRQWPENRFRKEARWDSFYQAFAAAGAKAGMLEFAFLALDGQPLAAHYGFVHKGRRYYFTPTYDVSYGKYSPGKILLRHLVDASFEQGVIFDFQNDLEPYKLDWATGVADRFLIKLMPN